METRLHSSPQPNNGPWSGNAPAATRVLDTADPDSVAVGIPDQNADRDASVGLVSNNVSQVERLEEEAASINQDVDPALARLKRSCQIPVMTSLREAQIRSHPTKAGPQGRSP